MKIAITGGKGGTGKSMVATSLAVELARNKKTILVDADVECPNDHLLLSIERKKYTSIKQPIPKWDFDKCTKCGKCADVCKQNAIVFVKGKYPAFVK
ncbi:MAG: P-loop NTPase, partial [Patescibacteria group bacterium]|nr:P-loop NTPase [Patescibacteria group bacterium]